ncbi:hypothetical protein PKHYL_10460 [Psychrobacter sp. KH172YL61]|nr:hypothetical protein PKHYL_10460 [Psychrobacter sp. KH172YL61]
MMGLQQHFYKTLCLTMAVAMLAIAPGCSSPQTDPDQKPYRLTLINGKKNWDRLLSNYLPTISSYLVDICYA